MELRGEFLLGDFRLLIEKALSGNFKAKVSIEKVRGGVFYPITFANIVLYNSPEGKRKVFEADEIRINYHLWDLLFNIKKRMCRLYIISPRFYVLSEGEKGEAGFAPDAAAETDGKTDGFLTSCVQVDVVDGSVSHDAAEDFFIREARGSIVISEGKADLKEMNMVLYGLPVAVSGTVNGIQSDNPQISLGLKVIHDYIDASAHAEGDSGELSISGNIEAQNGFEADFAGQWKAEGGAFTLDSGRLGRGLNIEEGYLDLYDREFGLELSSLANDSGKIVAVGNLEWPSLSLNADVRHWGLGAVDLSTSVKLEIECKEKSENPVITGSLDTEGTIINYKPSKELSMQFAFRRNAIEILGLKWGRTFRLVGKLGLESPNYIEAIALLDGTRFEEFTTFGGEGLQRAISGTVKGRLEIEGPLDTCVSQGHITARNGNIGTIYYENAVIHLIGKGPLVTIGDSRIYRETGYLLLNGEIDLRNMGKRNMFENVVVKTDDQSIVWDGWDISKQPADETVSLKKRITEELEIGFTTPIESENILEEDAEKESELELKYRLKGNDNLKMELKDKEGFVGVEHKIKF